MAQFIRIRRMKRRAMRVGTTNVSNGAAGTLINLDDPNVKRDLLNADTNTYQIVSLSADELHGGMHKIGSMNIPQATTDLTTPLTTGKVRFTPISFQAGDLVSTLTVVSSTTTAQVGTGPHSWGSLWSTDGTTLTCVAVSPDNTALLVVNTARTFTLGTAYTVPTAGVYYAGTLFAAGTSVPTLWGSLAGNAAILNAASLTNGNEGTATRTTPVAVATTVTVADVTVDGKVPLVLVG